MYIPYKNQVHLSHSSMDTDYSTPVSLSLSIPTHTRSSSQTSSLNESQNQNWLWWAMSYCEPTILNVGLALLTIGGSGFLISGGLTLAGITTLSTGSLMTKSGIIAGAGAFVATMGFFSFSKPHSGNNHSHEEPEHFILK